MSVPPQLIDRLKAMPIRLTVGLFLRGRGRFQVILKFIEKKKMGSTSQEKL